MDRDFNIVLVDLDNTIYDYERAAQISRVQMVDWVSAHARIPGSIVQATYDVILRETADLIFRSGREMRTERFRILASRLNSQFDVKLLADLFGDWLLEAIEPYPGAITALSSLMHQYPLMIVSEGYADIQGAIVRKLGIGDVGLFATLQTGTRKIDGSAYAFLAKSRGLAAETSVMIGDNWEKDIVAAASRHISTIWISHGKDTPGQPPSRFMGHADELIDALPLLRIRG